MLILQHPYTRWPLWMASWTVLALSFAAQFYVSSSQAGHAVSWRQALGGALGDWYVVAALAWPVVQLARRCTFSRERWAASLGAHGAAALGFSLAFMLLRSAVAQWQGWAAGRPVLFMDAFLPLAVKTWHFNVLIYGVIVATTQAVQFYRESQERAWRSLELEHRLTEARLMALQMQINPHFLFNALNSIATLIHRDAQAADKMLVRLASLLRLTLENTSAQEISLRAELEILQRYLDIERIRFGDRLRFDLDVAADVLEARVPTLLLQPIVENALQHGLSGKARGGLVVVCGRREGDTLLITVRDNGKGLSSGPLREGVGLTNTRARLNHLHGERHRFSLADHGEGGVIATVEIPFQKD